MGRLDICSSSTLLDQAGYFAVDDFRVIIRIDVPPSVSWIDVRNTANVPIRHCQLLKPTQFVGNHSARVSLMPVTGISDSPKPRKPVSKKRLSSPPPIFSALSHHTSNNVPIPQPFLE
jgi:hypothetical protein